MTCHMNNCVFDLSSYVYMCRRLVDMLKRTDGNIVHGGDYEEASLYMAPTLITDVQPDDSLMEVCV